jgi:hypothetical protein
MNAARVPKNVGKNTVHRHLPDMPTDYTAANGTLHIGGA